MLKRIIPLCFVAILLVVSGCKSGHSLVGKWTMTDNGATQTIEFTGDSKMSMAVESKTPLPMTATVSGTYTVTNDAVNIKFTDVSMKTTDPTKQALVDSAMASGKQQELDELNKQSSNNKIVWKSDDSVVITDAKGKEQTLTRVKS